MCVAAVANVGTSLPITPTFILPNKRFASPSLLPLAQEYVDYDQRSYRDVVTRNGLPIGYQGAPGEPIDERRLHRSTVWRWLGYLGTQVISLQIGLDLWQQHDPQSTLHRFSGSVAPHKYRSPQRDRFLRTARRLLHLRHCWDRAFVEKFFPRFATRAGFS